MLVSDAGRPARPRLQRLRQSTKEEDSGVVRVAAASEQSTRYCHDIGLVAVH